MTDLAPAQPSVVVFIPGIMGSELWLGEQCIWPGPLSSLVFRYPYMKELLYDELTPRDIIRQFSISKQYEYVVEHLTACGYRESKNDDQRTLWVLPYDWRKSNVLAAHALADMLDIMVRTRAPNFTIAIVAHSMGGLIARYYLESGEFVERPAFRSIQLLATLATPHRGSPLALLAARGQLKRLFLNREQVHELARDPKYPSLYELMPPRGEPFVWDREVESKLEPLDPYAEAISAGLLLENENLESASRFHSRLDPARRPEHVRYFFFSGTQQTTVTAAWVVRDAAAPWEVNGYEMDQAGDGTVPVWSSSLTGVQNSPTTGEHGTIYRSESLRRTLSRLLGAPVMMAAALPAAEIAVREPVVIPGAIVRTALTFPAGATSLEAELRLQLQRASGTFAGASVTVPLMYEGAPAESISVIFKAPPLQGVYRLGLYAKGSNSDTPVATDTLFVQRDSEPEPVLSPN